MRAYPTRDAVQIRQRRHVHDRHRRGTPEALSAQQLSDHRHAVLRFLHRQANQVVVGIHVTRTGCINNARQVFGADFHETIAAAHRETHYGSVGVKCLDFLRQADIVEACPASASLVANKEP